MGANESGRSKRYKENSLMLQTEVLARPRAWQTVDEEVDCRSAEIVSVASTEVADLVRSLSTLPKEERTQPAPAVVARLPYDLD
jgi:hypothetical protein